jgi:hypothetical protein
VCKIISFKFFRNFASLLLGATNEPSFHSATDFREKKRREKRRGEEEKRGESVS